MARGVSWLDVKTPTSVAGAMVGARLVGLALAMPHRQLGVDQGFASRHLEGAGPAFALLQVEGNLAAKLLL